jgi:glycosyltransferase involved in cell wall biosynthesis
MIDVLVISHACVTAINRLPYRRLADNGWNVEILVPSSLDVGGKKQQPDSRNSGDPPLHSLNATSSNPRTYTLEKLIGLLERRQPRLILIDGDPASRLAWEIGRWAQGRDATLVCLSCDNLSRRLKAAWKRSGVKGLVSTAVIRSLSFLTNASVGHVLVISSDGQKVFEEMGYDGRVTKIPLGFDPELFVPNPDERESVRQILGLDQPTIAYFGRMTEEKGVHILLKALARIEHEEWQLLLDEFSSYANDYQDYLKSLLDKLGLKERTVFFDASHEEMPAYMNAADIVVVPSVTRPFWKEQYGRIAPEAMACGRAVVVSDSGTLPELAGDAAVVFPEGDVDRLAEVLKHLLASPEERNRWGEAATRRAHEHLSVNQQVDIMDRLFRNLIGEPRAA